MDYRWWTGPSSEASGFIQNYQGTARQGPMDQNRTEGGDNRIEANKGRASSSVAALVVMQPNEKMLHWPSGLADRIGVRTGLCHENKQTRTWDPQTGTFGFEEEEKQQARSGKAGSPVCKWGRPLRWDRCTAPGGLIRWRPRWMPSGPARLVPSSLPLFSSVCANLGNLCCSSHVITVTWPHRLCYTTQYCAASARHATSLYTAKSIHILLDNPQVELGTVPTGSSRRCLLIPGRAATSSRQPIAQAIHSFQTPTKPMSLLLSHCSAVPRTSTIAAYCAY